MACAADPKAPAKRASADEARAKALKLAIDIPSSKDGTLQKVIYWRPDSAGRKVDGRAVPLLVFLHSWSGGFEQGPPWIERAQKLGWVLVAPDFRGPNSRRKPAPPTWLHRTSSTRSPSPAATPASTLRASTSSAVPAAATCRSSWPPARPTSGPP
jgi:hypothetical protein